MKHLHATWWLPALVAGAFILRVGCALLLGINDAPRAGSDQQEYDTYAWNLAQGRGYRGLSPDVSDQDHLTAYRPPLISVSWAILYKLFGHRYVVVRLFHCAVGAVTVLLLYRIGQRAFSPVVAWLAAVAYALWPAALLYASDLVSEPLGTLWVVAFVLAALWFADRPTWWRATGAGLLLGCGLLSRGNVVFLVPLVVLWALWQFRHARPTLLQALWVPVCGLLCLGPWTVRNYRMFRHFIPISTMGGSVLLQANNRIVVTDPIWVGYAIWDTKIPEYAEALRAPNDEYRRDQVAGRLAITWLKEHPDQWWFLVQHRFLRSWTPFLQPQTRRLYRVSMLASWGPVLVLFAIGFFPTLVDWLRAGHPGWIIHLTIAHFSLGTVVFVGYSRFRFPIEGLCLLLAAWTVVALWSRVRPWPAQSR